MRLDAALLLAVLAAPAAGLAAEATAPAKAEARHDKGVRFQLPGGFQVKETVEHEANEPEDTVWVATKGRVEVRVEVEQGEFRCTGQALAGAPRPGTSAGGRPTCELELAAPPSLDPKVGARRSTSLLVQFPGRHLSVVVFAPEQAAATRLARQVAATAAEEKP